MILGANIPYRDLVTPAHGTPILGSGNGFVLIAERIKNRLFENQMVLNEEEMILDEEENETNEIEETSFIDVTLESSQGFPNYSMNISCYSSPFLFDLIASKSKSWILLKATRKCGNQHDVTIISVCYREISNGLSRKKQCYRRIRLLSLINSLDDI